MRVVIDSGALARFLGEHQQVPAPRDVADVVLPVFDITPFLLAALVGETPSGFAYTPYGKIAAVPVPAPAAGAEWSQVVPAGQAWEIMSVHGRFTASVAVASRAPRLVMDDPTLGTFILIPDSTAIAATEIRDITWARGINTRLGAVDVTEQGIDFPNLVTLGPGHRVRSVTSNIQAADQWSLLMLLVRAWAV